MDKYLKRVQDGQHRLFIVSGPAGVGKDSIVNGVCNEHTNISRVITATTREPRNGEQNYINYFFYSVDEFKKLNEENGMLESSFFCGNYYGTPSLDISRKLSDGRVAIVILDANGAKAIKKLCPNSTTIFISPPSIEELEKRLRGRGSETEEKVKERLEKAKEEIKESSFYDVTIINESLSDSMKKLYNIISI